MIQLVRRRAVRNGTTWGHLILVMPFLVGAGVFLYDWQTNRDVASRERTTAGTIDAYFKEGRERHGYTFLVEGRPYTGRAYLDADEKSSMGQRVTVYYDRANPTTNGLRSFAAVSRQSLRFMILLAVLGSGLAAMILRLLYTEPALEPDL